MEEWNLLQTLFFISVLIYWKIIEENLLSLNKLCRYFIRWYWSLLILAFFLNCRGRVREARPHTEPRTNFCTCGFISLIWFILFYVLLRSRSWIVFTYKVIFVCASSEIQGNHKVINFTHSSSVIAKSDGQYLTHLNHLHEPLLHPNLSHQP